MTLTAIGYSLFAIYAICYSLYRYVAPRITHGIDAHRHSWTLKVGLVFLVLAGAFWLFDSAYWAVGVILIAGFTGAMWHRRRRSAGRVTQWARRTKRTQGVATVWQIYRTSGTHAVRKKMGVVRPSLRGLSRSERRKVPTSDFAILLGKVGFQKVWSLTEDVILIFGGTRSGKTGYLSGKIIDAQGFCLATSSRPDVIDNTAQQRAEVGPVYVFNAVGLGRLPSTIQFDVTVGCEDPTTAQQRAADLISAGSKKGESSDREFWDGQGERALAALLHACRLGGFDRSELMKWAADPDTYGPAIMSALNKSAVSDAFVPAAKQFVENNPTTRSSITTSIMPALTWLTNPAAAAAGAAGGTVDVQQLLDEKATIYLLGGKENHTAPLVAALTAHIARECRRIASLKPKGRLDPNATLVLDEAYVICPVPLEDWTSDMGGRGVTIIAAFQSRAQLLDRWGQIGAAITINNSNTILVLGGAKDTPDINYWSELAGPRDVTTANRNKGGEVVGRSDGKSVPILPTPQISNLPFRSAIMFCRGMSVAIGRVQMAWDRKDWCDSDAPNDTDNGTSERTDERTCDTVPVESDVRTPVEAGRSVWSVGRSAVHVATTYAVAAFALAYGVVIGRG